MITLEKLLKRQLLIIDAVSEFDDRIIKHANVLVLQYVISHFYNTNQISEIEDFLLV